MCTGTRIVRPRSAMARVTALAYPIQVAYVLNFVTAAIIEFLRRADEADIALLDQVKKGNTPAHIFFCYTDHKA